MPMALSGSEWIAPARAEGRSGVIPNLFVMKMRIAIFSFSPTERMKGVSVDQTDRICREG
jgi:hypothetical protein